MTDALIFKRRKRGDGKDCTSQRMTKSIQQPMTTRVVAQKHETLIGVPAPEPPLVQSSCTLSPKNPKSEFDQLGHATYAHTPPISSRLFSHIHSKGFQRIHGNYRVISQVLSRKDNLWVLLVWFNTSPIGSNLEVHSGLVNYKSRINYRCFQNRLVSMAPPCTAMIPICKEMWM